MGAMNPLSYANKWIEWKGVRTWCDIEVAARRGMFACVRYRYEATVPGIGP